MATKIIGNLIRYIVSEVQDVGGSVFRTRLVKLLYLCDVECYQSQRVLLSGLNWVRYKFGPYAFELPEITHRIGLDLGEEELDFSTGYGVKYEVYDVPDPDKWLISGQKLIIDRTIRRWGNEDLRLLLDYVYCETEPMKNAQFRQPLDFTKISRGLRFSANDSLGLSSDVQKEIKALLKNRSNISRTPTTLPTSNLRTENSDDESPLPPIKGKVKFRNVGEIRMYSGE